MGSDEQIDIFRVLSHPLRRKILRFIAERGGASYKDLKKIVPKPGALYHHLRLLGDLIYQDDKKIYRLSRKGERVYEFLISDFFVPEDKSIHKLLTPRVYFEEIEGFYLILIALAFVGSLSLWFIRSDLVPVFLLVIVTHNSGLNIIIILINYLVSVLIIKILVRILYGRNISYFDTLGKMLPAFILVNVYPLVFLISDYQIFFMVSYLVVQLFAILFAISAVSVVSRLHLRSALTVVLILHYASLIIVMFLYGYFNFLIP